MNRRRRLPVRRNTLALAALLALGAWQEQPAQAANCVWNPATGNWGTAGNWSCALVPGINDDASIVVGKVVTIDTSQSVRNLGNAGGINIDAFLLTLSGAGATTNTGTINVGGPSTAALQVSAGHNITNTGGVINIANGSVLNQFGSTITGGTINTSGTGAWVPQSSFSNFADSVTLGGKLDMSSVANGRQRILNGMTFAGGSIDVANGGILMANNGVAFSGNGSINLNDAAARFALEGNGTTSIGANVVVRGQGNIGQPAVAGGTHHLANSGRISADVNGGTLTIVPGAGSGSVINTGLIDARNGGTLVFSGMTVNNAGGVIDAQNASAVVHSGGTITGGTISSSGNGGFRPASNGGNILDAVTLSGLIDMTTTANSRERLSNGLVFAGGSFAIANGGILSINGGTQSFSGSGTINLNDAGARLALESSGTTTIGANVLVRGQGNVGQAAIAGGTNNLVNDGRILADVGGGVLNLVPGAGSGNITNNGILEASNGGTLQLSANVVGGASGQILAGAGSTVLQNAVTISGIVNTSGGGLFSASSSGSNVLDGVTLNGVLDMAAVANSRERIRNGLTLGGSVQISNGGILSIEGGAQALAGSGTINLNDAAARLALESSGTTTIGANVLVRGQGNVGQAAIAGGTNNLVNDGRILADVGGGVLNLVRGAGSGNITNNGILEASNGATLQLSADVVGGASGQILAGAGSTVLQNAVTISGIVNTSGGGLFSANNSGSNVLDGVTLNGVLDMAAIANARERIRNGLTLGGGSVSIGNGGILSMESGTQTLGGNGTINLDAPGSRLALESNGTTTIGANVVLRGQGNIGQAAIAGGTNNLVNNGRISADLSGGQLTIVPGAGSGVLVNNSLIDARSGGILSLANLSVNNAGGVIDAQTGSVVQHSASTITGGTISSSGTGSFRATTSGNNVLDSVTLAGVIDMSLVPNSRERISTGLTFAGGGHIDISNGGIMSSNGGSVLFAGSGTINLNDAGARFALEGNGTTTLGAGVLVRGQGNIGQPAIAGGTHHLVNQGTILGDGGTLAIVAGAGSGSFTNSGLLHASNGTVSVSPVLLGAGTLQVSGTGQLTLSNGGVNNTGTVTHGGSNAGSLNIGTQNLVVSADYTNANAGTGNSFNRRANVAGAGQIVAGGNAAQAITGTQISNGNTPNATMTIGNVRVGNTDFNYQVANTGTTGPTLRGALQTSVNGGNLTDARLSGSGVTPSNYAAPIAANSGDLLVRFNAAAAGALAALSGQVLNLRSNFENIVDQKLNIVLAAGAAAFNPAVGSTAPSPVVVANQRVGGSNSTALTVSNVAPAGAFSEDLNASFGANTGAATNNGGSVSGLLAGANNAAAMRVAVDTTSAGAKAGSATVAYQTTGAVGGVDKNLGVAAAGSQVINISGNVYQPASGNLLTPSNTFVLQVGQSSPAFGLQIRNGALGGAGPVAPAGFEEDLNARFGTVGSNATISVATAGQVNNLAAGAISNGAMTVTVTGVQVGNVSNFAVPVNYFSAGTVGGQAIAGLSELGVGSANFLVNANVSLNVVDTAKPVINGVANPGAVAVNFGNVRINSAASQSLNVLNQATGNAQAVLDASFAAGVSGAATHNGGSIVGLAPGASNNASMAVGLNTSVAGAQSGSATVKLISDATALGGSPFALPDQSINVQGNVYRLANGQLNTPVINIAARVGDAVAANQGVSITNNSPDLFTEGLKVSIGSVSGNAQHNGGSIGNLAAQATDNSSIKVGLANTSSAGINSATVNLNYTSTGAGTTGAADIAAGSTSVAVNSKIYTPAVGQASNTTLDFGTVRVGDAVTAKTIDVKNNAAATALNDTLQASLTNLGSPVTQSGPITGLAAQASSVFSVGLNTAQAGGVNANALISYLSQNPDMADASGGANSAVQVLATINNLANADFDLLSGAGVLTQNGTQYVLDLGTIVLGGGLSVVLGLDNDVAGPADLLSGAFNLGQADDFSYSANWGNALGPLAAGQGIGGLTISFTHLGQFEDAITFNGVGTNVSDPNGLAQSRTLVIRANLIEQGGNPVPAPGTLLLLLGAAAAALVAKRRRTH